MYENKLKDININITVTVESESMLTDLLFFKTTFNSFYLKPSFALKSS